jgi:outer membrane protein assembly factor BamA
MSFSDIMGDHKFIFAGDLQGNFKDYLHLYASYIYLKQRFDLGVGGYYSKDYSNANIFGDHFYHDTEIGGFFFARYPFSLLSRVDFEIYARNIKRVPIDFTGPTTDAVSLLPSLSYTFDNILWGLTGPLNGIRAKSSILFSPQLDFIDDHFISFDIDVRTYHHLFKRFVWANRVVAGASLSLDDRGSSRRYFLGGNDNWISYDVNREQYEKNLANTLYSEFVTPFRGFNYIDISGSRVAVYNTEFRFPFIKEISIVWPLQMQVRYLNGAIFADIGNAWDAGVINHGLPLPDKIYGGFGFGLRADLGIFILRFDRGWPTDWTRNIGRPINYFSLGSEF